MHTASCLIQQTFCNIHMAVLTGSDDVGLNTNQFEHQSDADHSCTLSEGRSLLSACQSMTWMRADDAESFGSRRSGGVRGAMNAPLSPPSKTATSDASNGMLLKSLSS